MCLHRILCTLREKHLYVCHFLNIIWHELNRVPTGSISCLNHWFHMMKMLEGQMTASTKRCIRGHYIANPRSFRNLLIWITASFYSIIWPHSYIPLRWFPLDINLLNPGLFMLIFHNNSRHLVLTQQIFSKGYYIFFVSGQLDFFFNASCIHFAQFCYEKPILTQLVYADLSLRSALWVEFKKKSHIPKQTPL